MVGHDGIRGMVIVKLTDDEVAQLQHSASVLKDVISNLDI